MGLCTAAAVLIADQVSKYYILNAVLEDRAMIIYTSWFNLVKAWNTGVSFSMFNDKGFWGVVMLRLWLPVSSPFCFGGCAASPAVCCRLRSALLSAARSAT